MNTAFITIMLKTIKSLGTHLVLSEPRFITFFECGLVECVQLFSGTWRFLWFASSSRWFVLPVEGSSTIVLWPYFTSVWTLKSIEYLLLNESKSLRIPIGARCFIRVVWIFFQQFNFIYVIIMTNLPLSSVEDLASLTIKIKISIRWLDDLMIRWGT